MSKDRGEALIARGDTELLAARHLEEAGFSAQATSRAYYAAFYAAEAALLSLGETRSKHSGVISAFGLLVVKKVALTRSLPLSCEGCSSCAASLTT